MRKHATSMQNDFCKVISGRNSLDRLNALLHKPEYRNAELFILTDSNTTGHCLPELENNTGIGDRYSLIEIPAGEESKEPDVCGGVWQSLSSLGAGRDSVLINLGGGVVSDIGGFVASTYMRGIRYFNVPTSLLGMVDAGMGGKTAINVNGLKNMAGTFYPPEASVIHVPFLKTLPAAHLLSGFAEMIKYALIADEEFWNALKKQKPSGIKKWDTLINHCLHIKCAVVESDPYEKSIRSILNFGHTIGHAAETLSIKRNKNILTHGEAVAIGLICESWLSHRLTGMNEELLGEICSAVISVFGWKPLPGRPSDLIALMRSDKKNKESHIRFTLLHGAGKAMLHQVCSENDIRDSLAFYSRLHS